MVQVDRFYTGCPVLPLTCRGCCAQINVSRVATPEPDNPTILYGWIQKGGSFCALLSTLQKQRSNWGDPGRQGTSQGMSGICTGKNLSSVEASKLKAVRG